MPDNNDHKVVRLITRAEMVGKDAVLEKLRKVVAEIESGSLNPLHVVMILTVPTSDSSELLTYKIRTTGMVRSEALWYIEMAKRWLLGDELDDNG